MDILESMSSEVGMPLLEDDDFFKNLDTMEQDFVIEGDIEDYGEDNEMDMDSEEDETFIGTPEYPDTPIEKVTKHEQLKMMHLRSHLNQLTEKVKHHHYMTDKTRDELRQCRNKISELESERNKVRDELQTQEKDGNQSALYRLRSKHDRLSQEISDEKEIEKLIIEKLEKEEYDLAKVEVERGKFLLVEDELIKKETTLSKEKTNLALKRLKKEERKALQAERNLKKRNRIQQEVLKEKQQHQQQLVESAHMSHVKHEKFVTDTVQKFKQRQENEDARFKEDMQRKMDMVLRLKSDITANRENLKALRARDKAAEKKEKEKLEEIKQKIMDEGGNPDQIMLIQKRISDFERQKLQFEVSQKEKQASIMEKLLKEEEIIKKRKKQQPLLWEDPKREKSKVVAPLAKKQLKTFQEFHQMSTETELSLKDSLEIKNYEKLDDDKPDMDEMINNVKVTDQVPMKDAESSSESDSDAESNYQEVDLAKPEFEGLWDHHKPYKVPKEPDTSPLKLPGASKMDKAILNEILEKQRASIVIKQVAAGREFTGCPFYSKPDVICFKDFDVGKTYKKKVVLTNVSYTVNYCKYLDITERLKDFITIHFDPPGLMSAGLTCEMLVTFQPMINEDLEGEVKFLSQTGPFSIPLKCTVKKCDLSVDTDVLQFGTTVIDETLKRTFTLVNKGALGTTFEFFKVTGMKAKTATSAQTSLGRMTVNASTQPLTPDATDDEKLKKETMTTTTGSKTEDEPLKTMDSQVALTEGEDQPEVPEGVAVEAQFGEGETPEQVSRDLLVSEMDDYSALDGMKVGPIAAGEIGPFSSIKLEIIWSPTVPGKVDSEFLVTFTDPLSDSISIRALGKAMDVPVWVERQTVDLNVCMFDRLYQDTIVVNNRATTALRLTFEVCKELKNHLELLPKSGYIQAQQTFTAQLKFLPRQNLLEEIGKYFDKETGVLEAPLTIRVADQTAPVPFTVTAVVTSSDMEFDVQEIDFGYCTIYESSQTTIKLTNRSILPQKFGFVGHPDYVEVQPNDGFGTLLPLETIELAVIFSPDRAKEFKFELNCKSLINREFKIQCKGIGVHPPLELSHQVIHFAATSLYDVSTASLHIVNSHSSMNEYTHPVPRIGKGDIAPVGPTAFEFVIPEGAPITISPSVGTIDPGQKSRIQVRFAPTLNEDDIIQEAVRMATKLMEVQAEKEYKEALKRQKEAEEAQNAAGGPGGKKSGGNATAKGVAAPKSKQTPGVATLVISGPQPIVPPKPEDVTKDSPAYAAAISSLIRHFKGQFNSYTVPCYVASGECTHPGELPYSVHNTLFLEIHCPAIKPPLVVISDNGNTTTDFGEVSIGQKILKSITVQNISSNQTLELSASSLDTMGPFQVMNALRVLGPSDIHTVVVSFVPTASRVFQEVFSINCLTAQLHITLMGRGVSPLVTLSPAIAENGIMDMGTVLAGEYLEKTFKMQNTSSLFIKYAIHLESQSLLHHSQAQELPKMLIGKPNTLVGVQNNKGQNVFDLVPAEGRIEPGGCVEITVTFAPDHPSDFFSDGVKIELFGKEECQKFQIKGSAKEKIMFIEGGDPLHTDIESLAVRPAPQLSEDDILQQMKTVLVTLKCISKEDGIVPVPREIYIGCVRTMAVSQKKDPKPGYRNGEFTFDNVQLVNQKGFTIDPQKGMVEAGVLKPINISWTPPAGYDPNQSMEASVVVTLKGEVAEQFRILLRAMTVSE